MNKEIKPVRPLKVRQIAPAPGSALPAPAERQPNARLTGAHQSLVDFMRQSPLSGLDELALERDCSPSREARP